MGIERGAGRIDPDFVGSNGAVAFQNSRKALAAQFISLATSDVYFIVACHFASKGGSDDLYGSNQPPINGGEEDRIAQAEAVKAFVKALYCAGSSANVIVLGDLNEFTEYPPLQVRALVPVQQRNNPSTCLFVPSAAPTIDLFSGCCVPILMGYSGVVG